MGRRLETKLWSLCPTPLASSPPPLLRGEVRTRHYLLLRFCRCFAKRSALLRPSSPTSNSCTLPPYQFCGSHYMASSHHAPWSWAIVILPILSLPQLHLPPANVMPADQRRKEGRHNNIRYQPLRLKRPREEAARVGSCQSNAQPALPSGSL